MGKGQSKSYDISTSPRKESHKRPKSSQQRESLLLNKDKENLNGDSNLKSPPKIENSVENQKETLTEIKKPEVNGIAESSDKESVEKAPDIEAESAEKSEDKEKPDSTEISTESTEISAGQETSDKSKDTETLDISENTTKETVSENLETKEEKSEDLTDKADTINVVASVDSKQEESDQIDKALDEYIETQEQAIKEDTGEELETVGIQEGKTEESEKEEEVIQVETDTKESVSTGDIAQAAENQQLDTEEKESSLIVLEENQEAQIDFEAEDEEKVKETEDKTVKEAETVEFKTVISLESTPPGPENSPAEADTREDSVEIVETPAESEPTEEPVVPVEEPALPESASIVAAEVPIVTSEESEDMSTVEAVVCGVDDLKDGEMKEVDVGEGKALLVKEDGQYYAIGNKCTHYGAPLAKGALCNGRVRCPWHGACFNVKTGDIEDFPGLDSLPKFNVTVADGKVKVKGDKDLLTAGKVQRSMCKQSDDNQQSVLIIGGGPSSVMCAETLRKEGFTGKITIATQETHLPYDRVKLSKAMDVSADNIALRKANFYEANDIDIQMKKKATSVDTSAKTVSFNDGSSLSYTTLVVATGGMPRQLPIPGADLKNVYSLRTPDDANAIAEAAKGKNVVIIGSSFIGMEVAAFLADKAGSLSVVDIIKVPFQLVLGEKVGSVLQKFHEDKGVKFHFEKGIKEFVGTDGTVTEAVLSDGTKLPCDLAILGVGVVPATDFLKESGINRTNRGFIPVDKNMKTNIDGVYATGDIVEFPLFSAGDQQVNVQHWQMAHAHGKTAALGILGKNEGIRSVPFFWTMMYGKSIRYTGYSFGYEDIVVHGDLDADTPNFAAFYTKGDDVVAIATLGKDPMAAQMAEIMYSGQKISKSEIQDSDKAVAEKFAKL